MLCLLMWVKIFIILRVVLIFKLFVGLLVIIIFGLFIIVFVIVICCCFLFESLFGSVFVWFLRFIRFRIFVICLWIVFGFFLIIFKVNEIFLYIVNLGSNLKFWKIMFNWWRKYGIFFFVNVLIVSLFILIDFVDGFFLWYIILINVDFLVLFGLIMYMNLFCLMLIVRLVMVFILFGYFL